METKQVEQVGKYVPKTLASWMRHEMATYEAQFRIDELGVIEDGTYADEDEVISSIYEDHDFWQNEYDHILDRLTEVLSEIEFSEGPILVRAYNVGWQNLSGAKLVWAETGKELLEKILPDTDCQWELKDTAKEGEYMMAVYHHDSPTGEFYYLKDVSADWCIECEELHWTDEDRECLAKTGMCVECQEVWG